MSEPPFGSRILGPEDEAPTALRVRVQSLTTASILGAQVVGVAAVIALVLWVLPTPPDAEHVLLINAVAVPLYVVAALVVGVVWGTRSALGRLTWLAEERPPTPDERRTALRLPLALVRVQGALWGGGVVVFTVLTLLTEPDLALTVGVAVTFGGVVTCMAAYLLTEFVMRPVAARALVGPPPDRPLAPGVTGRSLLAWALGSAIPVAGLVLVAILALVRDDVSAQRLAVVAIVLGGITLAVGALVTTLAVRATVDPVRTLRGALERVERGDLEHGVAVFDGTEVGLLQAAFNRMIGGLRERERIRDLFGRHVGEDVARDALAREVELGGEVREVSVLFVDVIGSSAIVADRPPDEVVTLLNRFFAVVVDSVDTHGGTVNKFEGDGALAVFGAPVPADDHACAALRAARTMRDRLREEVPECPAGIGVATGSVVAGNVGEHRRFEYTVIGDPVHQASRLCDQAKETDGRVLAALAAVERADADEAACWEPGAVVSLRGRPDPVATAVPRDGVGQ